jgi:hypothetical protein
VQLLLNVPLHQLLLYHADLLCGCCTLSLTGATFCPSSSCLLALLLLLRLPNSPQQHVLQARAQCETMQHTTPHKQQSEEAVTATLAHYN